MDVLGPFYPEASPVGVGRDHLAVFYYNVNSVSECGW